MSASADGPLTCVAAVARRFGVDPETARLGQGGEAVVFALDEARVLRVYRTDRGGYVARLAGFLADLDDAAWSFAVPAVLEHGEVAGLSYSIDRRIPGRGLDRALASLTGAVREQALAAYVDAALRLREASRPADGFGELLADDPVRRATWPAYLRDRVAKTLAASRSQLRADVPAIDRAIVRFHAQLALVAEVREPALVHGDYFPGNVIADRGRVTGVIDFGPLTVAGDWRMDAAGALWFMDVVPAARAGDAEFVRARLAAVAPQATPVLELYRTFYALYFSFTKHESPELYDWCVRSLRAAAAAG